MAVNFETVGFCLIFISILEGGGRSWTQAEVVARIPMGIIRAILKKTLPRM